MKQTLITQSRIRTMKIAKIDTKITALLNTSEPVNSPLSPPFALNLGSLRIWLDELPIINPVLSCEMLLQAFKSLDTNQIPGILRFQLIEEMRAWPSKLLSSHEDKLLDAKYPLNKNLHDLVGFSINFQRSLATAYIKIILSADFIAIDGNETANSKVLFNSSTQATVIHRTMESLGLVILKSAQSYQALPLDIWGEINSLFKLAQQNNITLLAISNAGFTQSDQSTIYSIYKCLHFFQLSSPNRFNQREINSIYKLLTESSGLLSLSRESAENNQISNFFIDISSDKAADHISKLTNESEDNLFFHTQPFLDHISSQDVTNEPLLINTSNKDIRLPPHTIRRLLQCWNHLPARQFSRKTEQKEVTVYPNIQNVLKRLFNSAKNNNKKPTILNKSNISTLELIPLDANTPTVYTHTIRSEQVVESLLKGGNMSIWDKLPDQKPTGEAKHFKSHTTNTSAKGYQVNLDEQLASQIKVGDLTGISINDGELEIAVIRRMGTLENDSLSLGLELIAPHAEIVKILTKSTNVRSKYILLLPAIPAINQAISIISPSIIKLPDNIISLSFKGKKEDYRIQKLLESNSSFTHYTLEEISDQVSPDIKLSLL